MTPDLARVHDDLDRLEHDARALTNPLADAQLTFQPDAGTRWSIAQNLDHLARANVSYLDAMQPALDRARAAGRLRRGALAPGAPGRWFLQQLEPPPRKRVRAPKPIRPASAVDAQAAIAAFAASLGRARRLLGSAADLDLNATRFQNPFVPLLKVRASTGFLILAAHGRRHLWQARQVLDADGFPR